MPEEPEQKKADEAPDQVDLKTIADQRLPAGTIVEKVDLEKLAKERVPGSIIPPGTYLQWAGMKLFSWIAWITVGILTALFLYLLLATPTLPKLSSTATVADSVTAHLVIDQRAAVFGNFLNGLEKLILNFCLPLMTGILGYLFGTGGQEVSREAAKGE
jgi:hypothetical protein